MNAPRRRNRLYEGDTTELEITSIDGDGMGVGTQGALSCHVAGAFAGERVIARITHVAKQRPVAHGVVVNVVRPHRERRRAPCTHHDSRARNGCTGCPLMLLSPQGQHALKQERLSALGLSPDRWVDVPGGELFYRWSSKRVAQGTAGRLMLGSYQRGSHRIADMITCQVDHPRIAGCALQLQRLANDLRIAGYDETTRQGELRYVWFKTNGSDVLVTLVIATEVTPALRALADQLTTAAGVACSTQRDSGNNMRGSDAIVLRGASSLRMQLADVALDVGPLGFLQPNPAVAALAYHDLCHDAAGARVEGTLALDVYAGAGATTQQLRRQFTEVHANDADPESARSLQVHAQDATAFLRAQADQNAAPQLIVCNPPRGGIGADACEQLLRLSPARIHIMSCNPESLAKDLAALGPRYRLEGCRAYDTLPQTWHVEVVAWLVRHAD